MLYVREEDVPDDGDAVDVEDAERGGNPDKVDVLGRRPETPVELEMNKKTQVTFVDGDDRFGGKCT